MEPQDIRELEELRRLAGSLVEHLLRMFPPGDCADLLRAMAEAVDEGCAVAQIVTRQ